MILLVIFDMMLGATVAIGLLSWVAVLLKCIVASLRR